MECQSPALYFVLCSAGLFGAGVVVGLSSGRVFTYGQIRAVNHTSNVQQHRNLFHVGGVGSVDYVPRS